MATPFNTSFQQTIADLIGKLGTTGRVLHIEDDTRSPCVIAFSQRDENDVVDDNFGTIVNEQVVAYISNISRDLVVGDKIVVKKETFRISDIRPYKPAGLNIAFKVLLDL